MTLTNEFSFTPEELADLERPIGEARGLPGKAYGETAYRLEQHQLFPAPGVLLVVVRKYHNQAT